MSLFSDSSQIPFSTVELSESSKVQVLINRYDFLRDNLVTKIVNRQVFASKSAS
jgi:hypothetical protein